MAWVGLEQIVGPVLQPSKRDRRSQAIAFCRVIEHDVENDLDVCFVQGFDHISEFVDRIAALQADTVPAMWCEIAHRIVSPVIRGARTRRSGRAIIQDILFVELLNGQQLDGGDPQLLKVGDLFDQAVVRARVLDTRRGVLGETTHVHFIDHRFVERMLERCVALPVIVARIDDDALFRAGAVVLSTLGLFAGPVRPIDDLACIRVQQDLVGVEAMPHVWSIGTIHSVGIDLPRGQAMHENVPIVERAMYSRVERDRMAGLGVVKAIEQQQFNGRGVPGKERKVHALRIYSCAERVGTSGSRPQATLHRPASLFKREWTDYTGSAPFRQWATFSPFQH